MAAKARSLNKTQNLLHIEKAKIQEAEYILCKEGKNASDEKGNIYYSRLDTEMD